MAIDVSKFHQTFFDESLEGLELMESGLLELEEDSDDNEAMNTIFRAAHSIKGGAGTLGFTAMAEFTHLLETILDRRRAGRSPVTQETIDVLLASVDILRDMLDAVQSGGDPDADRVAQVATRLQDMVDRDTLEDEEGGDETPTATDPHARPEDDDDDAAPAAGPTAWHIEFAPHPHLFRTGNDPVRILGELAELGDYQVTAEVSDLPALDQLDIEVCYSRWTIELTAAEGGHPIEQSDLDQVFEWVEDDADITITAVGADSDEDAAPADGETEAAAPAPAGADTGQDKKPEAERRSGQDRRQEQKGAAPSSSIRVDIEKVDKLINMVGELVITQSMLQQLTSHGEGLDLDRLREGLAELEGNTRELQSSVMQIRMLPISFAFSRLPRLVRDLASKLDKEVELEIHGETTELDKTVMEKIGDPLVHLVRNSLDHGIETPERRVAAGKPETGTVTLSAYHEGGTIVIEIADDGAGLNTDKILAKARDRGVVGEDDQLSQKQLNDLIFHPGLSTADSVSDVSGRGVGMDVVKRNINDLGGVVDVTSTPGKGTTFQIRLPLTLAILDGQVVRVGDQVFIIPLISIVESLQFDGVRTGLLAKGADIYRHRDQAIPLINLHETLGVRGQGDGSGAPMLVVVDADGTRAGLIVHDLLAQQQIVIKSLTTNFRSVPGLSGATILGDGTVAMIVDVNSVLALYRQTVPAADQAA